MTLDRLKAFIARHAHRLRSFEVGADWATAVMPNGSRASVNRRWPRIPVR